MDRDRASITTTTSATASGFGYGVAVRTALGGMRLAGSIGELKWDSGSGTYFGVDPKLDMIYILMEQVDKERGPIRDSLRKLIYGALLSV